MDFWIFLVIIWSARLGSMGPAWSGQIQVLYNDVLKVSMFSQNKSRVILIIVDFIGSFMTCFFPKKWQKTHGQLLFLNSKDGWQTAAEDHLRRSAHLQLAQRQRRGAVLQRGASGGRGLCQSEDAWRMVPNTLWWVGLVVFFRWPKSHKKQIHGPYNVNPVCSLWPSFRGGEMMKQPVSTSQSVYACLCYHCWDHMLEPPAGWNALKS